MFIPGSEVLSHTLSLFFLSCTTGRDVLRYFMWWMSGDQYPPLYCDARGAVAVPDSSCSVDKRLVTQ